MKTFEKEANDVESCSSTANLEDSSSDTFAYFVSRSRNILIALLVLLSV